MRADNLIKMTNSVSDVYTKWLNADTQAIYDSLDGLEDEYEKSMDEIENLSEEILGMTGGEINPMILTDAREHFGESSEAFLNRTLLTGSDIAMLTHAMIENFAAITLELPKANPQMYT